MRIIFSLLLFVNSFVFSQERNLSYFNEFNFQYDERNLPYRLLMPFRDNDKKKPLIVFLHGSGERGNDNSLQLIHGSDFFLKVTEKKKFNSYVLFPQCDKNFRWSSHTQDPWKITENDISNTLSVYGELVINLIKQLIENYNIDPYRVYISGLSMGGYGTFDLTSKRPDMFAAAIPICGGSNLSILKNAVSVPHWIFHGELDRVVSVKESRDAFNLLKTHNNYHKYTEFKNTYHNSWEKVFESDEFIKWMFSKTKRKF